MASALRRSGLCAGRVACMVAARPRGPPLAVSATRRHVGNIDGGIQFSLNMQRRAARGILENIDLIVYDMAGTTVQEGGIVYKTLQLSMKEFGLDVPDKDMEPWHGAKKEAVVEHFARLSGKPEAEVQQLILD